MTFIRFCGAFAVAATLAMPAFAEITRPECVAPANPGGGFDLTCRIAQTGLEPQLGTAMEVNFMPGGICAVAYSLFNTTRTDDASAIVAFSTGSLLNIATGKYGEFDENDVRWVATAGADFGAVIVRADSPYQDLSALMADFSKDPASVVVGAGGSVGSQDWMKAALLLRGAGGDPKAMRYVAFDGGGDAIAALLGGSIGVYTGDMGEMTPHLEAG
ncbi:MAG: tripartite tricarboxylate transporter substrate-binding protein, partial [Sulfitobacter sp.]|nr:tripartite tricarboxylate transporter substrate-binding protein [Sulfitobacter sp.]